MHRSNSGAIEPARSQRSPLWIQCHQTNLGVSGRAGAAAVVGPQRPQTSSTGPCGDKFAQYSIALPWIGIIRAGSTASVAGAPTSNTEDGGAATRRRGPEPSGANR